MTVFSCYCLVQLLDVRMLFRKPINKHLKRFSGNASSQKLKTRVYFTESDWVPSIYILKLLVCIKLMIRRSGRPFKFGRLRGTR